MREYMISKEQIRFISRRSSVHLITTNGKKDISIEELHVAFINLEVYDRILRQKLWEAVRILKMNRHNLAKRYMKTMLH